MSASRLIAALAPRRTAHAHCDVPCGIYDPATAQLAARTVSRMVELMLAIPGTDVEERNKFIRCTAVKEQHAEQVKREVQVIWSDYFKPEHLAQFPDLHDVAWKILKQAGKCKQSVDVAAAADLEVQVARFAEIFWATKNAPVHTMKPSAEGAPKNAIAWEVRAA
ncbi:MAG TPA: superoxide dismutase, Ni [Candidatus Sulfotelmatobacter sp.]|nr:superoxide dismutase, Ni [Candidatus Sulfotelmatobacter sp.]